MIPPAIPTNCCTSLHLAASMKIAVINLARSEAGRELVQSNIGRLGLKFEFFTGIDASG
jgi:hypothetical protein